MPEATYESIEPLIAATEVEGATVRCTFRCPVTKKEYDAEGPLVKGRTLADISSDQSLLGNLRVVLGSLLRGALGGGPEASGEEGEESFSEEERKAGVLLAFRSIANKFVRDEETGRWIAAEDAGDLLCQFAKQLGIAPVLADQDREIASRMLVEVARADGQVTPTEWEFLAEFIPGNISSVDTFMMKPALKPAQMNEATRGAVRDTMLMLAWALAHVDEDLDPEEDDQLLSYARGLKIPESRAYELRDHARTYLLEHAFALAYPKGKLKAKRREEALAMGKRFGLEPSEIAEAEARLKRRLGI